MSNKDLRYIKTIKRKGAKWDIYYQNEDKEYTDIWIRKQGYGLIDFVIGLKSGDDFLDVAGSCIADYIDNIHNAEMWV